ncbi:MAG: hypothetical protein H7301_10170 [Cryobacterium sp.]|nr:hypothetical protein [Oligoflexia bacterium]
MASPKSTRRYRINPLELAIFTLVTAGFGYSVFHLFRDAGELQFATLAPMQIQPNRGVPARSIASVSATFDGVSTSPQRIPFEVNCAENPGFQLGDKICPGVSPKLAPTPHR